MKAIGGDAASSGSGARGLHTVLHLQPAGGSGVQPAMPEHGGNIVVRAQTDTQAPIEAYAWASLTSSGMPKTASFDGGSWARRVVNSSENVKPPKSPRRFSSKV
jgi:hypothetical protein